MDIAQIITDRIIAELEQGVAPWVKPWSATRDAPQGGLPYNPVSRTLYRGMNHVWLSMMPSASQQWVTFKQALSIGGCVRKGEKGTPVVYWSASQRTVEGDDGETRTQSSFILRHYTVFSIEQCDGLTLPAAPAPAAGPDWSSIEAAESMIGRLSLAGGLAHGGDSAFYAPSRDSITLPARSAFRSQADYYATMLHEAIHATGHKTRLDRLTPARFASEGYAFEELVAELGAAMLCAHCGIDGQLQHASYIDGWLRALKGDKRLILTAAAKAQAALDWLKARDPQAVQADEQAIAA